MTKMDVVLLCLLIVFTSVGACYGLWVGLKFRELDRRVSNQQKFNKTRENFYQSFADPKKIEEEMEAGARLREMYDAKRRALPRDDAGPPAVIHNRPNLRAVRGKKAKP